MDSAGGVRIELEAFWWGGGGGQKGAGRAIKGAECNQQNQILVNMMPTSDPVLPLTRTQNRGHRVPSQLRTLIASVTWKAVLGQTLYDV